MLTVIINLSTAMVNKIVLQTILIVEFNSPCVLNYYNLVPGSVGLWLRVVYLPPVLMTWIQIRVKKIFKMLILKAGMIS